MDFNPSKECVGKALLMQSPPGTPWDRSQAAGCLIRAWMRLCCRKATEKTITTPWLIDFYCDGNSSHRSSLQHSHHFLLLRAIPSTPVQFHPGWQCVRQPQLTPSGSPVSRSQDLSAGGASRQRWHGQPLAGCAQEDWCTPTAQQLISSKQLHQGISVPDNLPPRSTHTSAQPFQNTDFSQCGDRLLERFLLGLATGMLAMNLLPSIALYLRQFKGAQTWIPPAILK